METNKQPQKIGIIGGGQLGKMMILEAKRLGFYVAILDPTKDCPASSIADTHIVADFDDASAIGRLANLVDVITYEFEHIGTNMLKTLEKQGRSVYPTVSSLEEIQNKWVQKNKLAQYDIPVPEYVSITSLSDLEVAGDAFGYPLMMKTCTLGYDGKGNVKIDSKSGLLQGIRTLGGHTLEIHLLEGNLPDGQIMVERFVPYTVEISVLACRGIDGTVIVYPVGENHHVDSILDTTVVPARISDHLTAKAKALAKQVMDVFHGVGMFCVEMFVTPSGDLLVNEVAPRPHNSGHYTIEACLTNQFEQHIRAITGLPFGDVSLRSPVVMRNLLGGKHTGKPKVCGLVAAYENPYVKVHIYGKTVSKYKRKMGHLTVCHESLEEALTIAGQAYQCLSVDGERK